MATEDSLLDVFAHEASAHLATLRDDAASDEDKRRAAANLREAAALIGEHAIARAAAALLEQGPGPSGVAELETLVDQRARRRDGAPREDDTDLDESGSLRRLFRDEADETLERVARTLLGLGDRAPGPGVLSELMRTTHTLKGSAGSVELGPIGDAAHALEDVFDTLRARGSRWSQKLCDRLVEAIDVLRMAVESAGDDPGGDESALREQLDRFYEHISALDLDAEPRADEPVEARDERAGDAQPIVPRDSDVSVLRIDARRIDRLMDSVGELAFDRTRITRRATEVSQLVSELERSRQRLPAGIRRLESADTPEAREQLSEKLASLDAELERQIATLGQATTALLEDADALRRTGKALQDGFTRVRMLTVSSLFRQLAPQLRAMARAAGKRVRLETSGGNAEFDKAVASQVLDALLQLLRNAVAHGIEAPEIREKRDKPAEGRVAITARQEGSTVVLDVSDDGSGIDPAALRRRLVESGRWSKARAQLASDREVMQSLFDSGTTQRDQPDSLAGRGVGLSAVRETIARLGGEIDTRSVPGQGTRFSLRLPVTAAVSHALLFKIGGEVFALPQSYVHQTAHVDASSSLPSHLRVQSGAVPLVCLHEVLGAEIQAQSKTLPAVVLAFAGKELAITCDKIVGPREIVIKQLGPILSTLPLYAGGTISGSGKVQLILDPAALVRLAFPETSPAGPSTPARSAAEPPRSENSRRALAVDDSRSVRESLANVLIGAGYETDTAGDGARAWSLLRKTRYDVLITDLEMPELGGFELLEKIFGDSELSQLCVIVISARDSRGARERAAALGARAFLCKPIEPDALLSALAQPEPTDS